GLAHEQHVALRMRRAARLALHLDRRGARADEAREGVFRAPALGELLPGVVQVLLQARELRDQRLQRRLGLVEEHHAERADDLARFVAQRQAAHYESAGLVGEQIDEDRLAGLDDVAHLGIRHHFLNQAPHELLGLVEAERRQEFLVGLVDPHHAAVAVHEHHSLGHAREEIEHRARGELEDPLLRVRHYSVRACGLGRRPTVMAASTSPPWRLSLTLAAVPGGSAATRLSIADGSGTGLPSISTRMSPGLTPALSAGPPRSTPATSAPRVLPSLKDSAMGGVISCTSTPIQPRVTLPDLTICSSTILPVETGIAKPMPIDPPEREKMAVLMPIRLPEASMSAPPEFPGLMAASV